MTDRPTATRLTVTTATLRRAEAMGFTPFSGDVLAWALDRLDGETRAADLHRDLNRRVAAALGLLEERTDPELGAYLPSWHDMPEQVAALVAERDRLAAVLADLIPMVTDALTAGAETLGAGGVPPPDWMIDAIERALRRRLTTATIATEEDHTNAR